MLKIDTVVPHACMNRRKDGVDQDVYEMLVRLFKLNDEGFIIQRFYPDLIDRDCSQAGLFSIFNEVEEIGVERSIRRREGSLPRFYEILSCNQRSIRPTAFFQEEDIR